MKARDIFDYKNQKYAPLKEPARGVVDAAQRVNRFLDTVQEWFYIEAALPNTSKFIHKISHLYPQFFDQFINLLHERHLMGIYPSTPELVEEIGDVDKAFEIVIGVMDEYQEALEAFHRATDNADFRPMALKTEEFMLANSQLYTKILQAWNMWDKGVNASSFDNWVLHLMEDEEDE